MLLGAVMAILAVVLGICVYFIWDINHRFPNITGVEQYTKENPAVENGLQITPLDSYEQYCEAYQEAGKHSDMVAEQKDKYRILVFHIRYENLSDKTLVYMADNYQLEGEKSGLANGVLCENSTARNVIEPGEVQDIWVSALALGDSLVSMDWLKKLDTDRFFLVYWRYPVTKELVFE